MQVVIAKDKLLALNACDAYLKSPEWDPARQALVYSDWEATVDRLSATRDGIVFLEWLVARELVPMTRVELSGIRRAAREARRLAKATASEGNG